MTVSAADIAAIRRMTAVTNTEYSDDEVTDIVERYPVADAAGNFPTTPDGEVNADWTPRYDLHAAAADIWDEKASSLAARYDFTADGSTYHRSQAYNQAMQQARWHRSRRMIGTHRMVAYPRLEQDEEV
jgi:hypothetical protein